MRTSCHLFVYGKNIVITRFDIGGGLLNKRRRKEKKKCNENRLLDMQLMKVIHRQCCKFEQAGHFLDVKEMQNGPLNKSTAFRFHFTNNSSKDNKNTKYKSTVALAIEIVDHHWRRKRRERENNEMTINLEMNFSL